MSVRLSGTDEQGAIVAELEPMVRAVASLRTEAARLQLARAALLDSLLAGETAVVLTEHSRLAARWRSQ